MRLGQAAWQLLLPALQQSGFWQAEPPAHLQNTAARLHACAAAACATGPRDQPADFGAVLLCECEGCTRCVYNSVTYGADHAHAATAATAAAAAEHAAKHAAQAPTAGAATSKTAAATMAAAAPALLPEAVHHAVGEAHELLARGLVGGVVTCPSGEQRL